MHRRAIRRAIYEYMVLLDASHVECFSFGAFRCRKPLTMKSARRGTLEPCFLQQSDLLPVHPIRPELTNDCSLLSASSQVQSRRFGSNEAASRDFFGIVY